MCAYYFAGRTFVFVSCYTQAKCVFVNWLLSVLDNPPLDIKSLNKYVKLYF